MALPYTITNGTANDADEVMANFNEVFNNIPKASPVFGGTGADGALSINSGTTSLTRGVVYNYSSISITGTAKITATGGDSNAQPLIIKCSGDCTISSTGSSVDLAGKGIAGASAGTAGNGVVVPTAGSSVTGLTALYTLAGGGSAGNGTYGGSGGAGGSGSMVNGAAGTDAGGGGGTKSYHEHLWNPGLLSSMPLVGLGGGGGGGGDGSGGGSPTYGGAGGAGGAGGGAIYLEVAGNLTISGTFDVSGVNGTVGSDGVLDGGDVTDGGGGGGGGGGGTAYIIFAGTLTDSGTYTVTGGTGGAGGAGQNGGGAGGAGGDGGSGRVIIKKVSKA